MLKLRGSTTSSGNPLQSVNFDFGSDCSVDVNRFNPLEQFDHFGKKKLDQVCHCLLSFNSNNSFMYLDKMCIYFVAFPNCSMLSDAVIMMCRMVCVFKLSSKARSLKKMKVRHCLDLWLLCQTVKLSGLSRAQRSNSL